MKSKWTAIIGVACAGVLSAHATLVMDWKGMAHSSDLGYNTATVALSGITYSSATKNTDTFGSTAVSVADFSGTGSLSVGLSAGNAFNFSTWASTVTNFSANAARGLGVGTGGTLTAQRGLNNAEVIVFTIDTSSLNTGGHLLQFRVTGWNSTVNLYEQTGATSGALLQSSITATTPSSWYAVDGLKTFALQAASGTANFATLEFRVDTETILPPAGLSASARDSLVQLDWNAYTAPGFDYYKIYRSSITNVLTGSDLYTTATTNTFTDSGVTNGVTYYYAVSAVVGTNAMESALSSVSSATPLPPGFVKMDWSGLDSNSDRGYNTAAVVLSDITSSSAIKDTDGFSGTAVTVFNFSGTESLSVDFSAGDAFSASTWSFTARNFSSSGGEGLGVRGPNDSTVLSRQRGINSTEAVVFTIDTSLFNGGGHPLQFRVGASKNSMYLYEQTGATAGASLGSAIAAGTTSPWHKIDGFQTFAVRNNGTGSETRLATLEFQLDTETIVPPAGLRAYAEPGFVQLDWFAHTVPGFDSYKIYRSSTTANLTEADLYTTVTTNTFTDTAIANNLTYYYAVSVVNTDMGETDLSRVIAATPPEVVLSAGSVTEVSLNETVSIDVRFGEAVTGLNGTDFSLSNAAVVDLIGNGDTYTLVLTPAGNVGDIMSVSLPANVTTPAKSASFVLYFTIFDKYPVPQSSLGYKNAALLGHSYFYPTANVLEPMAEFCGYLNQVNTFVEANPGASGAPGAVWDEYTDNQGNIIDTGLVSHIKKGGVELLGMTYFYNIDPNNIDEIDLALADPAGFADVEVPRIIQDYRNWIDLTLDYNAGSLRKVFVMTPWIPDLSNVSKDALVQFLVDLKVSSNGGHKSATQKIQNSANAAVRGVVDILRAEYPSLDITVIPAGNGLMAIWELYALGQLPDITAVSGTATDGIYRDSLHGGNIVYQLNHLMWLACLFPELDIRQFDYLDKSQFSQLFDHWQGDDLRQLAWQQLLAEPYSGVTDDSQQINHGPVAEWLASSAVQDGAIFPNGVTSITAKLDAWDPDGNIAGVELLFGTNTVAVSTVDRIDLDQPYYQGSLSNPQPGLMGVTARITDGSADAMTYDLFSYITVRENAAMENWQISHFDADLDGSLSIIELLNAARGNDFDGDGISNLGEYAFGGNPASVLDPGDLPTFSTANDTFHYVHPVRTDDPSLVYSVETCTNLVSGSWINAGYTVSGINVTGSALNYVTNAIPAVEEQSYIRLRISMP